MKYLFVLLLLASCVSQEERMLRQIAYTDGLRNRCAVYGFERGTPQMAQCMMQLDSANRQNAAMSNAALMGMSQQMIQNSGPIAPAQTICTPSGNSLICR